MSNLPSDENGGVEFTPEPATSQTRAEQVKSQHEDAILALDGVVGIGVQTGPVGDEVIVVYLQDNGARERVPATLEEIAVEIEVTGDIDAY